MSEKVLIKYPNGYIGAYSPEIAAILEKQPGHSRIAAGETEDKAKDHIAPGIDNTSEVLVSDLLTVPEVAAILRCAPSWLYRHQGMIPGAVRIGAMVRFNKSQIMAYLESGGDRN